jgi:hypothetical protein
MCVLRDAYFFGYGHDYNAAMADFYTISGRQPLLSRYLMGPQYSQWHAFNENDVRTYGWHSCSVNKPLVSSLTSSMR